MKLFLLLSGLLLLSAYSANSQSVFDPLDPIVRWDSTKPVGSPENPDQSKTGLQKWVSVATNSISTGYGAWDASAYKAYYINVAGRKLSFRLKFPNSYSNPDSINKKYPMMLFFHGAGEPGCPSNGGIYNNEKQLLHGGQLFMDRVNNNLFDGFLIYPQVVVDNCSSSWPNSNDVPLLAIIDSIIRYSRGDIDRLFVNGLSDGGRNTWRFARTYPQRIATIGPSSMSAMTTALGSMIHIPVWFASGGLDSNPSPAQSQQTITAFNNLGGNLRYTLYPELGHSVWNQHWAEPDYLPFMNDMHKANPLVFFLHNEWCAGATIAAKMGLTSGFYAYEWMKDGVVVARRTATTNTILVPAAVTSFTGNEITVKQYGTYSARFRRTSTSNWSIWSPKPIVVKVKNITQPLALQVQGIKSKVLPAPDGSTTVPLTMSAGFLNYRWYRSTSTTVLATQQVYNAAVGIYRGKYDERFGCGANYSPNFTVVSAAGNPKPSPATQLKGAPVSQTVIGISWTDNPAPTNNETGFEIYRGAKPGGPYQLIGITLNDVSAFQDSNLSPNTNYYYLVRAVNNTGAAASSNEASCRTLADNTPPVAPTGLMYAGSTVSSVSLRWNSSTDNISIRRYDIYINGVKHYSTPNTSFTVNNLDSLKWYAFTIRAVDGSGNESAPAPQVMGYTHHRGLNFKYVNGSFTAVPDFNTLTPVKTGVTSSINSGGDIRTQEDDYALLWEGFIYIPQTAFYTFATYSDEGSKVWIDIPYAADATPVVNNDGVHEANLGIGFMPLSKGYHRIVVSYFEKSGSESLGLFWTNNEGIPAEQISDDFFTPDAIDGIPPLIIPSGLTATAQGFNKIKLEWQDNSNDETGFEIMRSSTSGGQYVSVGRTGPNKIAFTDSALSSATTYYYKIRSIGATSESPYTAEAFETTQPAPGTPIAPSALKAENSTTTLIALNWIDNANNEDNYQVWRSADEKVSFQLMGNISPNSNSFTDQTVTAFAKYYYYVVGGNVNGNGASSDTIQVIAGNNAPAMSNLSNMFVKTDATVNQNFTVTDAGDNITISIDNKPSFITLQNVSGNTYRIILEPTTDNIGWYNLAMKATDSKGAVTTKNFTVTVADKNTRSVYVNFGSAGKTAPAPWNNWLGVRAANNVISNLKDENNVTTAFSVTTLTAWTTTSDLGHLTGNNSGVAPDSVLQSALSNSSTAKQIRIGGLNPAMRYNLEFISSQNEGLNAETEFMSGLQRDTVNARYNTNTTANLNSLLPDASGQILVTVTMVNGSLASYLNGLVIEEYAPAITLLNPLNLYAETVDRTTINVSWSDRTNNESPVNGYELTRATDSLFTLNVATINLAGNVTFYQNTGLNPDTKYWYRVRAKLVAVYSDFSNRAKATTPSSIVYVNFNANVGNASAPWNNTIAQPTSPTTFANLLNQAGLNSGIDLRIEQIFNGEFSAGMSTGNNSGVVPDLVLQSNYWIDKTQISQMRLSGLNQTMRYRIGFIGSSGPNGWYKDNYTATYTVNGRTVYLNSWSNSSKVVYIDNIQPDENGEALLTFSTTAKAAFGFNAGLIIQDYTDGPVPDDLILATSQVLEPLQAETVIDKRNRMYPNPFGDIITVDYNNTSNTNRVSALVYDVAGRLVLKQDYSNLVPGMNQLRLNTGSLKAGNKMFTVVLATNGKLVMVSKMVKK
jgi:hypothetical protein